MENIYELSQSEKIEALNKLLITIGYSILDFKTDIKTEGNLTTTTGVLDLKIIPDYMVS